MVWPLGPFQFRSSNANSRPSGFLRCPSDRKPPCARTKGTKRLTAAGGSAFTCVHQTPARMRGGAAVESVRESIAQGNALLLCGGGSRGAIEIGLYKALLEENIPIDLIIGTSVGAINGALIAAGYTPAQMAVLWSGFERKTLFPFNWRILWQGWTAPALFRADRLARVLKSALPVRRFEELRIPLIVTATDLQSAEALYLDSGDLLPALLASTALPPYLPPVECRGHHLIDGGVVANMPIGEAIARGATRIFALSCHCLQELAAPPRTVLELQGRALRIAIERQMRCEIARWQDSIELILLEPCFDFPPSVLTIARVASLIEESHQFVKAELRRRGVGLAHEERSRS